MKAILATIPSDSHSWNLVFMDLLLKEHGFETVNLGVCTPIAEISRSVVQCRPDLIVISSVNGHAYLEGPRILEGLRTSGCRSTPPVVIGGKLGIKGKLNVGYAAGLLEAGFDRVFVDLPNDDGTDAFSSYLMTLASSTKQYA
jgi:methylaspartate mutase sigma subunit